jgi:hypothetical protein
LYCSGSGMMFGALMHSPTTPAQPPLLRSPRCSK